MISPFVPLALAWFVGLWVAEWLPLSPSAWLILFVCLLGFFGFCFFRMPPRRPYLRHTSVMAALMVLFLLAGGTREAYQAATEETLSEYNNSGTILLWGTIDRYPERRDGYTTYTIAADLLVQERTGQPIPVQGRLLVNLPHYPEYGYGDQLKLTGELQSPRRLPTFDYRAYLAIQGIHSTFRATETTLLARQQGAPLFQALNGIRARAEATVRQLLPEPHASLLNGILLGLNGSIPEPVQAAFSTTGATHVLVISGANFSVLVAVVSNLAQKGLGQKRGVVLSLLVIALYALMVGGDPPVLRAAAMGSLILLARIARRTPDALNGLAFVVVLLTAYNPNQRADIGFQLSALATLGLILFVPFLSQATTWLLAKLRLSNVAQKPLLTLLTETLLLTVAAQLITTPLIVGIFGKLSLVSLLTNLLIVPMQAFIMQSGAVATVAGMVWLPIGQFLSVLPYVGLAWTVAIVEWTAQLPFASIEVGPFASQQIWMLYSVMGMGVWFITLPAQPISGSPFEAPPLFGLTRRRLLIVVGLLAVATIPWWVAAQRPDGQLHLYMFDVGQGDALLIVTPEGRQMLIDGGEEPSLLLRALGEVMPFWDRSLDLVVLTHPDQDHLGGLPELLNRYEVGAILQSGDSSSSALYEEWQATVATEGVTPLIAQAGQRLEPGDGVVVEVLAPRGTPFAATNLNSVVLEIRYGNFCALLTGDIELESEQRLIAEKALEPCQLLKVAHHGSTTSTSVDFLAQVAPHYALISAGSGNPFGHPSTQVLERLEASGVRIFRTDQQGTIHFWTDGEALWVVSER